MRRRWRKRGRGEGRGGKGMHPNFNGVEGVEQDTGVEEAF